MQRSLALAVVFAHTSRALLNRPAPLRQGVRMASTPALYDPTPFYAAAQPQETKDFYMQQTMVRVKDPETSLKFYIETLGFKLLMYRDFPQWGFSVYFVAHGLKGPVPADEDKRWDFCMRTPGCIELTWNHGSEKSDGAVYNTGNGDATGTQDGQAVKGGFGHLGITVPDVRGGVQNNMPRDSLIDFVPQVYEACERFKKLGCTMTKTPNGGGMKGLAFIADPDGYLIEILPQGPMITKPLDCDGVAAEGGEGYKDNSKA